MTIKRFYFDLETSGLDPKKNAILQLYAIMEVNDRIVDKISLFIKPFTDDIVEPEATAIHGLNPTEDKFIQPRIAYKKLERFLDKHIDKYNTLDKAYMVGYNCQDFDRKFLYEFFMKNGNQYMYSYFYPETLDVFVLIGYACQGQRPKLGDGKLVTYAKALDINVDDSRLHDAQFDTELVYDLFQIFKSEYPV